MLPTAEKQGYGAPVSSPEWLRVLDPQWGANAVSNFVIKPSIETRPKPVIDETEILLPQYRVLPD